MTAPSTDIKDLLTSQATTTLLGESFGTFGTDLFIGHEPPQPENCTTIYDMGGRFQNPKQNINEMWLYIQTRNHSYTDGYAKIEQARMALEGISKTVVNNTTYLGIWVEMPPMFVHRDKQNRSIFTMKLRIMYQPQRSEIGHREFL